MRRRIVQECARRHQVNLTEILCEQESGDNIVHRPVLRQLLDLCAAGKCKVIVTPEQARILRGDKRDEQEIEDCFLDAGVRLVSASEGVIDFGSPDYDPLPYEVRALVARHELRAYRRRRQASNRQKARMGKRYCGFAPYGYRSDPEAPGGMVPDPREYDILCELFRRIRTESLNRLVDDLNRRGILPPSQGRKSNIARRWHTSTLHGILTNPVYTGYPAQQQTCARGRRRALPEEEWVLSEEEQSYPHPISLAEWREIRSILQGRSQAGARKTVSSYPLTGLLRCAAGYPMRAGGPGDYGCGCKRQGREHPGMYLDAAIAERIVVHALHRALPALLARTDARLTDNREDLARDYQTARRRQADAQRAIEDLTRNVELLARAWGEEGYLKAAEQARSELADAQARLSALEASIEEQRALADVSLLDAARRHGVEAIWAEATANERRALARFAIRRIEVAAPPRRRMHVRQVTVELRGGLESVTVRIRDVYLHYMTRRAKERKEE